MSDITQLLKTATQRLGAVGIANANGDARRLLMAAAGVDAAGLTLLDAPSDSVAERFAQMLERRMRAEPVSRIVGRREFWSLEMELCAATLDPRPETETLVRVALDALPEDTDTTIYDPGCGSGCILLAILSERLHCFGVGMDIAPDALLTARRNASRHGLSGRCAFVALDWLEGVGESADMIVANPPYIRSDDICSLDREVRLFDPHIALDGGADGLDPLRKIAASAHHCLIGGGALIVEIAAGSAPATEQILDAAGYTDIAITPDLAGTERVAACRKP